MQVRRLRKRETRTNRWAGRSVPILSAGLLLAMLTGCSGMRATFQKEILELGLSSEAPANAEPVSASDIAHLPEPAQRYFRFMGVVGKPRDWSFRMDLKGQFRTNPEQAWMDADMIQYSSRLDLARIFHIKIRMFKVVPVIARDTYVNGKGRMLVKALDWVAVQDATGEELDIGELVTYLNDAVLLAPSFLLVPEVTWTAVDDDSFDIALTDSGRTVRARVYIDETGAPVDFSTTDRFATDPEHPDKGMVRAEWRTPVGGWVDADGRKLPTKGSAVWHLPQGEFEYARLFLKPGSITYNVPPSQAVAGAD